MIALLCGLALAGVDDDVRVDVGDNVHINWTTLRVEGLGGGTGGGVGGQRALEQRVRSALQPAIRSAVGALPVRAELTVQDLWAQDGLGVVLKGRVKLWAVTEARYYASGRIELIGELDLAEFLRPWSFDVAPNIPAEPVATPWTGVVVDARGLSVQPAFAPRLVDEAGGELYDGAVWRSRVLDAVPVIYVHDAAHPASDRAGANPLVVRAVSTRGVDLVIEADGARALGAELTGSLVLGEGTVVVLVDR